MFRKWNPLLDVMRTLLPLSLLLLLGCGASASSSGADELRADAVAKAEAEAPERTLRQFLRAFLDQDEVALRRLSLDCRDRQELWSFGAPIPHRGRLWEFLKSPMRRVRSGETLYLPDPEYLRPVGAGEDFINDRRVVIVLDDNRMLPWLLVGDGGTWRVDPHPFVQAIKVGKEPSQAGAWPIQPSTRPVVPRGDAAREPEVVVRELMLAMARGDREVVLANMMPNPDVDVLLRMRNPDDEAELVELFRTLPITRLRAGDELADPFTPGQLILPGMIDEDHLVLVMHTKGSKAWTFFLVRDAGGWRVNLDWAIEALKRPAARPRIVPGSPPRIVI